MENLQALREALMAKQGQMGQDPGMPPGALPPGAEGMPPVQGGSAGPGMDPMAQVPPEVQLAMEQARIKEDLKRVRMGEVDMEIQEILRQRMADIEEEAAGLFESGAKK